MFETQLAWRILKRELRKGQLTIFICALALAVATVFATSMVTDRLQRALTLGSSSFIAADRQLKMAEPAPDSWLVKAQELGLQRGQTQGFNTMLFAHEQMQLAGVKAVSVNYPLRGELLLQGPGIREGDIYLVPRLARLLQVKPGDVVELGETQLTYHGEIIAEPDAGFNVFTLAPRALIHLNDVAKSQVVMPGSRVSYHYLFNGEPKQLESYGTWLADKLTEGQSYLSVKQGGTPVGRALNRAESYFSLASLLGVLLSCLAISLSAFHFSRRHSDFIAMMKTLGASQRQISRVLFTLVLLISVFSIICGLILGFAFHQAALAMLASLFPMDLPAAGLGPLLSSVFIGLVVSFLFSFFPLLRLRQIPPLRVLRADISLTRPRSDFVSLGSGVFFLSWFVSGSLQLTLALLLGLVLFSALVVGVAYLLLRLGHRLGAGAGGAWRLAFARLHRFRLASLLQLAGIGGALLLLGILWSLRSSLLADWRQQLPEGTPNHFLLNIAQHQVQPVEDMIVQQGFKTSGLYPMVRGRLTKINHDLVAQSREQEQTRRPGIYRELNSSWTKTAPEGNQVVQGEMWQPGVSAQVSVESEVAERLKIGLGDSVEFNIGGQMFVAQVTSIRLVDWDSMRPNFYFIFNQQALAEFPATYISSLYLPADSDFVHQLLSQYTTISVIDVGAMINAISQVLAQVSKAVELLLYLILAGALLVLMAQVSISMKERSLEITLLRTLGAGQKLLTTSIVLEFAISGAVAGLTAALVTEIAGGLLNIWVFELDWQWHPELWLVLPVLGMSLVSLVGWLSCRSILHTQVSAQLAKLS